MKNSKLTLAKSLLALLMCVTMLVSTTFAWFTDSVTSSRNMIATGTLDVELYHSNGAVTNERVTESTQLFLDQQGNPILWEPGVVSYENLRIVNEGSLALVYQLALNVTNENYIIDGGNRFGLSQVLKVGVVEDGITATDRDSVINAVSSWTKLESLLRDGSLIADAEKTWGIVIYWQPGDNDNNWNANNGKQLSSGTALSIDLGVNLTATQEMYENDSFGNDYDVSAKDDIFPSFGGGIASAPVDVANGLTTSEVEIAIGDIKAIIPTGVKVKDGVNSLSLTIKTLDSSSANIVLGEDEALRSLDVHVEGVAADNTTPIVVFLPEVAPKGLNLGNYKLYHVENGATNEMTLVAADVAFDAHNQFKYDPATGDMALYMATFSEVAMKTTPPVWKGEFNYEWYDADAKNLTISNADQLAAFGAIVGGMNGQTQDSFAGKTVKLIADINLGDDEDHNNANLIFYPIGYYNSEGTYERTNTAITSGLRNFEGTFDGNGHTISNFYHNTWEMKGDHNWYSPEEQYYRDGMGLFGKVYGGTVKNLTVKNFSSDGEIATTGVIAAYADGATFENIAIVDCNPRVYNIGNGGIVGCVGWYAKETNLKTTFKNITVDNSNKISALWGSYDVACGGIVGQYYPTSGQTSAGTPKNGGVHFENCHVSAQMDVYNDVCANYQYYAYRYTGMLIGSVRENVTIDGHSYPKMDGITAENSTVHFGTWNDYYYCEIIDNTTASYTHDYQMSRLTEIKAIDGTTITYLDGTTGTVPASGRANYVIVDYTKGHGTENATCYHFKDGKVWNHEDGGKETINGAEVLKEDKQHIYLEFNNLVTGYGWGVTTKGVGDLDGVKILDREVGNSVEKFESEVTELVNNKKYKLGDIFTFVDKGVELVPGALTVSVTNLDENNPVSATIKYDRENWENGTITFAGTGEITITIQDYYFCTPTTINVTINERQPEVKFESLFTNTGYTYRVGNNNAVTLSSLFAVKNGVSTSNIAVTVANVSGNAGGTPSSINNVNLSSDNIKFNGTGKVKVTITDNDYCTPTELIVEVVDAVNATTATSATKNNVVLLQDAGFSSLEVSGGYTLYGNGFTLTCGSDSAALDFGYSFVTLNNGILDNVQIVTPNYDYAALYKSNLTSDENRSQATDKTRYYNAKSAVTVSGNSQILNSRISGARAAVNVTGGNLIIDNSRIEGGAVANILIGAANSVTLRDITLIQKPTDSTYKDSEGKSKTLMGFSVLYMCDSEGNAAPTTLEGTLVQQAWASADDKKYVPEQGANIVDAVLQKNEYLHNINDKSSVNLGFAYLPEDPTKAVSAPTNVTDKRSDQETIPYATESIRVSLATLYVFSYKSTNGTNDSFKNVSKYVPNKYSDIITVNYSDTADGLESGKSFGTDGWVYELNVDLDKLSGYKLDFSKLSMSINGTAVNDFKVNENDKPTSPVAVTAGGVTYTLTATVNGKEYTATYKVTGTETSKESPSKISGPTTAGFGVAKSYGGDWSGAADVLTGVKIKYWSVAENKYVEFDFSNFTVPGNAGKLNGTNSYWEYTHTNNDFTLKVTNTVAIHSGKSVYGMPIRGTDGKLYFTISSTNGYVGSGTTSRAIAMQYEFTDNNGGEKLTFTHTFNIGYSKDEQYSYSDLSGSGTLTPLKSSSGGSTNPCVTPDTLITLADGSQVRVDSLKGDEMLLVWNLETGKYEVAPIVFVDTEVAIERDIIHLYFSNGSDVKVLGEHGFFDLDLGKYVYIDANNYADYIGHRFVAEGDVAANEWNVITLDEVVIEHEVTTAWSPVTFEHLCYYTNGVLSMPGGISGLFNIFEVDTETMTYDAEQMQKDIETYGLLTLEDFGGLITQDAFDAFNGEWLLVAIGKGQLTWDDIAYMAERYIPLM